MTGPPSADPNRTIIGNAPTINATQTIKPVQCPVCKTFNPAGMMFCVECGLIFDRALPEDAFGAPAIQLPVLVEQSGREHPVRPGENLVGREGDVQLPDSRVSRRHARITADAGELFIEDLGSTNGTRLDGEAIEPGRRAPLADGQTISLGGFEIRLQLPGAAKGGATKAFGSNKTAAIATAPRVAASPATLVGGGTEHPLKEGLNTFGRKSDNDVQIADPYVSGRHGVIEITEDGIFLTDTGSTNGTMLNDARLSPNMRTRISEEDVIRLGSLELQVRLNEQGEGSA